MAKVNRRVNKKNNRTGASRSTISKETIWHNRIHHHKQSAAEAWSRSLRHPVSSVLVWLVIAVTLTLPLVLVTLVESAAQLEQRFDRHADINVFFAPWVEQQRAREMDRQWQQWNEVGSTRFVTPAEGLKTFQQDTGIVLPAGEDNPLPALLIVTPKPEFADRLQLQQLLERLQSNPDVLQAQLDMDWLYKLSNLVDSLEGLATLLAALFAAAVLLIVGNSIRLSVIQHHQEIEVLKLVGATKAYIRRPFLYNGLIDGCMGGLIAIIFALLVTFQAEHYVASFLSVFEFSGASVQLKGGSMAVVLVSSGLLGLVGAWFAVDRRIARIEPS